MRRISLSGLSQGLILPFIPLLLQVDTNSQVALESHIHDVDCAHPVTIHQQEDAHKDLYLAGYGSCAYCGCTAFTESYNDSYRCSCGHGWNDHYSAGA